MGRAAKIEKLQDQINKLQDIFPIPFKFQNKQLKIINPEALQDFANKMQKYLEDTVNAYEEQLQKRLPLEISITDPINNTEVNLQGIEGIQGYIDDLAKELTKPNVIKVKDPIHNEVHQLSNLDDYKGYIEYLTNTISQNKSNYQKEEYQTLIKAKERIIEKLSKELDEMKQRWVSVGIQEPIHGNPFTFDSSSDIEEYHQFITSNIAQYRQKIDKQKKEINALRKQQIEIKDPFNGKVYSRQPEIQATMNSIYNMYVSNRNMNIAYAKQLGYD